MTERNIEKESEESIFGSMSNTEFGEHHWEEGIYPETKGEIEEALRKYQKAKAENKPIVPDEMDSDRLKIINPEKTRHAINYSGGFEIYSRIGQLWKSKIRDNSHYKQICRDTGTSEGRLGKILNGEEILSEKKIRLINKALNIKPYELKQNKIKIF